MIAIFGALRMTYVIHRGSFTLLFFTNPLAAFTLDLLPASSNFRLGIWFDNAWLVLTSAIEWGLIAWAAHRIRLRFAK